MLRRAFRAHRVAEQTKGTSTWSLQPTDISRSRNATERHKAVGQSPLRRIVRRFARARGHSARRRPAASRVFAASHPDRPLRTPSAGLPHSAPSTDPADKGGGRKTGPGSLGPTVRQSSKTSRKTLTAPVPSDPRPGGRCWIRTNVGYADGFTDRSLWPLGQPAVLGVQRRRQ